MNLGAEQLVKAVFDAVDVGEVLVVGLGQFTSGEYDLSPCRLARFDSQKRVEGVGASFDLFYASTFDRTEMEDCTVSWRDLEVRMTSIPSLQDRI